MFKPMVSYERWISIAAATAESKYGRPTFEESQENIQAFARVWNSRKTELKRADEVEAAAIAEAEF